MCLQTRLFICTTRLPSVVSNYPGPQLAKGANLGSRFSCAHLEEQWKQRARARANFGAGRGGPHVPVIGRRARAPELFRKSKEGTHKHKIMQAQDSCEFLGAAPQESAARARIAARLLPRILQSSRLRRTPLHIARWNRTSNRVEVQGGRARRAAAGAGRRAGGPLRVADSESKRGGDKHERRGPAGRRRGGGCGGCGGGCPFRPWIRVRCRCRGGTGDGLRRWGVCQSAEGARTEGRGTDGGRDGRTDGGTEGRRERSRTEGGKQGWKEGQREERADSRATCSGRESLRGTDGSRDRGRAFV